MRKQTDDKSRILTAIITHLERAKWLCLGEEAGRDTVVGRRRVRVYSDGRVAPQFIGVGSKHPPEGSIVKCKTNPHHDWGVSRFVSGHEPWLLREIGNPKHLLRMYNERLDVLIGVPQHELLEGWERQMYDWAIKATSGRWNKRADYYLRFRGAEIHDGVLTVRIGRHIWVDTVTRDGKRYRYQPRSFDIPVNPKTRLKDIVQALCDANFDAEWTDDELALDEV